MIRALRKRVNRIAQLEAELNELRARLDATRDVPGANANTHHTVRVGGEEVNVLPLPPRTWVQAVNELPSFLLAYASTISSGQPSDNAVENIHARAREWLRVCARKQDGSLLTDADLERLSVPEAGHAVVVIARVNGLDENLREFFLQRLERPDARSGSATVRH